jgi:hypothetical protein
MAGTAAWGHGFATVSVAGSLLEVYFPAPAIGLPPDVSGLSETPDDGVSDVIRGVRSDVRVYTGRNILPLETVVEGQPPNAKVFHHFDPVTKRVSFWDHEVDLQELVTAAATLLQRLDETDPLDAIHPLRKAASDARREAERRAADDARPSTNSSTNAAQEWGSDA